MAVRRIAASEMPTDRSAVEGDGFTATFASFDTPERADTWHHHGEHHIVGYLLSGRLRIETPLGDVIDVRPGDLVHIEPRTVHRETYEGHIELVGFGVGTGPGRIDQP